MVRRVTNEAFGERYEALNTLFEFLDAKCQLNSQQ